MGSNKVDFLNSPVKDHGISNLLYEPLDNFENRFDLLHDYRKNDAHKQGKCSTKNANEDATKKEEQGKSAGIMAILDLEQSYPDLWKD